VSLVIFDCDGVLVDTEPISAKVGAAIVSSMGWELSAQEVLDRFLGCTEEYFRAEVQLHTGLSLAPGWDAQYEPLYDAAYAAELGPVDGITEVLDELDAMGVPCCVASNGSHDKMRRTLGVTGLLERFEGRVFSADDVSRGKPAPDLYLHAASTMRVQPDEALVVEDSPRGVEAARAAGMSCVGFAGRTPPRALERPGVTVCTTMAGVLFELRRVLSRES
jgi:HAD superfamily hydrolase (TIGR01509 family)